MVESTLTCFTVSSGSGPPTEPWGATSTDEGHALILGLLLVITWHTLEHAGSWRWGVGEMTEAQPASVGPAASQHSGISLGPLRIFVLEPTGLFFREPGTGAFAKAGMWRRELRAGLAKRPILVFWAGPARAV